MINYHLHTSRHRLGSVFKWDHLLVRVLIPFLFLIRFSNHYFVIELYLHATLPDTCDSESEYRRTMQSIAAARSFRRAAVRLLSAGIIRHAATGYIRVHNSTSTEVRKQFPDVFKFIERW
jgi:hypothetical protein